MTSYKPSGHNAVSPYLLIGNVNAMLRFLSATFSSVELYKMELPDGTIKHAEIKIDDSVIMMGERPAQQDAVHCSTHVYVKDVDACYRNAISAGATSIAEPKDQPYGDRSAGVKDSEGNIWWLGTHLNKR